MGKRIGIVAGLQICAGVRRSTMRIGPWHFGHFGRTCWSGALGAGSGALARKRQSGSSLTFPIGQPPEVSKRGNPFGRHAVEIGEEFFAGERHRTLLAVICIILPPE